MQYVYQRSHFVNWCVFAGSVIHSAAWGGHCSCGTFGQWQELLCESAGKLLSSTARPGAAGWKASAHLPARLPPLQGQDRTCPLFV